MRERYDDSPRSLFGNECLDNPARSVQPDTDPRFLKFRRQPISDLGVIGAARNLCRRRPCEGQSGNQKGGMISLLMEFPFACMEPLVVSRFKIALQIPDNAT